MSNDELQKAIDDITKSDAGGVAEGTSENEALVDEMVQAGMPTTGEGLPLAPLGGADGTGVLATDAVAPEMAAAPEIKIPEIGAMPPAEEKPTGGNEGAGVLGANGMASEPVKTETVATPAIETAPVAPEVSATVPEAPITEPAAAEVNTPEINAPGVPADLAEIEKEALKELYPLLDKVKLPAEEKFEICMKVAGEDKKAISGALEAAKEIVDETKRAEALLSVLGAIK